MARRGFCLGAAAAFCLCATLATAPQAVPAAAASEVTIKNFAFVPATLKVRAGTKVIWINRDEEPHTIVSADPSAPFKSPGLDTGERFGFVFSKPGTYRYFCSIHPQMVGTIIVK